MRISTQTVLLFLFALLVYSCKKDSGDNTTTPPHDSGPWSTLMRIVHQHAGCKDSTLLSMSGDKLQSTTRYNTCAGGSALKSTQWYVYDGGKVYILDTSFMTDNDTLVVDAALRILEVRRGNAPPGTVMLAHYQYSAQGLLVSSVEYYSGASNADTTQYTFTGGDISEASNSSHTWRYSYYDKKVPDDGYFTQNGLAYGSAFLYKNVHLLKDVRDEQGNLMTSYTYDFDSYGNIIRKLTTDGTTGTVDTTRFDYLIAIE